MELIRNGNVHAWSAAENTWVPSYAAASVIDIRDFGAKCDDNGTTGTDDAAAIQAAIDSLGTNSTTRGGPHILIPDHTAIGSTITIDRKSLIFRGLGWGRQGSSGVQPYLRWIGAAGSPMLRVKNVQGIQIRDLHFIGKASAKPSCAISLFQVVGFGINQNIFENIAIGDLVDGTSIGTGFVHGIAAEGAVANNDTWFMRNIVIDGCSGYGIRQSSIQNVVWMIDGLTVTHSANGVYAVAGQLTGRNWSFGSVSDTTIYLPKLDDSSANAAPDVNVFGYVAENSSRLAQIDGAGWLKIENGQFHYGSFTASDGKYIKSESGGNGGDIHVELRNFGFQQMSAPPVIPFISVRSTAYASRHFASVILMGINGLPAGGPQSNGVSAETRGLLEYRLIELQNVMGASISDYAPYPYSRNFLGGRFNGGEVFQVGRVDVPGRIAYSQHDQGQAIASASATIALGRRDILLRNTSGGPLTLTSTPTIPDGANGEEIQVMNVTPNSITLQDESSLANSNMKLALPTLTLAPYDSITLKYLSDSGGSDYTGFNLWVQTGGRVASLAGTFQPLDSDLTAIAALTPSNDDIIQRKSGAWTNRTMAQLASDLGVTQAWCRVYNNAAISINDSTVTALTFNSERNDATGMHSTSSNTSRITINTAGFYLVGANVQFAASATGNRRQIRFLVNGATIIGLIMTPPVGGGNVSTIAGETIYQFAANDYVEVHVFQDSGGALNVESSGNWTPEFWVARLGS